MTMSLTTNIELVEPAVGHHEPVALGRRPGQPCVAQVAGQLSRDHPISVRQPVTPD
jgi:hypothetical protein